MNSVNETQKNGSLANLIARLNPFAEQKLSPVSESIPMLMMYSSPNESYRLRIRACDLDTGRLIVVKNSGRQLYSIDLRTKRILRHQLIRYLERFHPHEEAALIGMMIHVNVQQGRVNYDFQLPWRANNDNCTTNHSKGS